MVSSLSYTRRFWKCVLLLAAIFWIVLVLLRPQFGTREETVTREGQDILIALDTSLSMNSEDLSPSRFERAKREIATLIDNLKGDRLGLIAFSGKSYVQCPLTLDYSAVKLFLNDMSVGMIPTPGTNMENAIRTAIKSFNTREKKFKVLIIFTDGENLQGNLDKLAQDAKREGVAIYSVGLGSEDGEPIPIRDDEGILLGYKKDKEGTVVISKLNSDLLKQFAQKSNGYYYQARNTNFVSEDLYRDISLLEKKQLEEKMHQRYQDKYQPFLLIALFFLLIECIIPERKKAK
ncbi:MAG: VWA domain-containing protein [Candidatus Margulisbacteria bacterium]|nr:VWA domain-containing protein [Candidatus Margulisiibacteriota bacterium]